MHDGLELSILTFAWIQARPWVHVDLFTFCNSLQELLLLVMHDLEAAFAHLRSAAAQFDMMPKIIAGRVVRRPQAMPAGPSVDNGTHQMQTQSMAVAHEVMLL